MSELGTIIKEARALRAAQEPFLLATVVRVRGSAYRRPGARMLLTETRWITGSISGGCLEGDIVNRGFWRTREAPAVVVTYDGTLSWRSGEYVIESNFDTVLSSREASRRYRTAISLSMRRPAWPPSSRPI